MGNVNLRPKSHGWPSGKRRIPFEGCQMSWVSYNSILVGCRKIGHDWVVERARPLYGTPLIESWMDKLHSTPRHGINLHHLPPYYERCAKTGKWRERGTPRPGGTASPIQPRFHTTIHIPLQRPRKQETAMPSDSGDFLGTAEGEVSLLHSIMRTRPVGIHRHVHIWPYIARYTAIHGLRCP